MRIIIFLHLGFPFSATILFLTFSVELLTQECITPRQGAISEDQICCHQSFIISSSSQPVEPPVTTTKAPELDGSTPSPNTDNRKTSYSNLKI